MWSTSSLVRTSKQSPSRRGAVARRFCENCRAACRSHGVVLTHENPDDYDSGLLRNSSGFELSKVSFRPPDGIVRTVGRNCQRRERLILRDLERVRAICDECQVRPGQLPVSRGHHPTTSSVNTWINAVIRPNWIGSVSGITEVGFLRMGFTTGSLRGGCHRVSQGVIGC